MSSRISNFSNIQLTQVAQKKRMRIEEQKRRSKRESELALTPESRQALIEVMGIEHRVS